MLSKLIYLIIVNKPLTRLHHTTVGWEPSIESALLMQTFVWFVSEAFWYLPKVSCSVYKQVWCERYSTGKGLFYHLKVAPYCFNSIYTWRSVKNWKWSICFNFGFKLLAFTVKISITPGISLPWQQAIAKITIFLLFSTYLLPFLELAAVKYLETR